MQIERSLTFNENNDIKWSDLFGSVTIESKDKRNSSIFSKKETWIVFGRVSLA